MLENVPFEFIYLWKTVFTQLDLVQGDLVPVEQPLFRCGRNSDASCKIRFGIVISKRHTKTKKCIMSNLLQGFNTYTYIYCLAVYRYSTHFWHMRIMRTLMRIQPFLCAYMRIICVLYPHMRDRINFLIFVETLAVYNTHIQKHRQKEFLDAGCCIVITDIFLHTLPHSIPPKVPSDLQHETASPCL